MPDLTGDGQESLFVDNPTDASDDIERLVGTSMDELVDGELFRRIVGVSLDNYRPSELGEVTTGSLINDNLAIDVDLEQIRLGAATGFDPATGGTGIIIGRESVGNYDFRVGDSANYIWWDDSAGSLTVGGTIIADTFTATDVTIEGTMTVESNQSGQRIRLEDVGGDAVIRLYDASGVESLRVEGSPQVLESVGTGVFTIRNDLGDATSDLQLFASNDITLGTGRGTGSAGDLILDVTGGEATVNSKFVVNPDDTMSINPVPAGLQARKDYSGDVEGGTHHAHGVQITQDTATARVMQAFIAEARMTHATGTQSAQASGLEGFVVQAGAGTLSEARGVRGSVFADAGTITDAIALWAGSGVENLGTITNNYGLKVDDQTVGASNWAIKTGSGLVEFGDQVTIGGAPPGSDDFSIVATGPAIRLEDSGVPADWNMGVNSSTGFFFISDLTNSVGRLQIQQNGDFEVRNGTLHVTDGDVQGDNFFAGIGGHGSSYLHISADTKTGTGEYVLLHHVTNGNTFINAVGTGDIYFREDNNNLVLIENGGDVGIGTTNPEGRLHVTGGNMVLESSGPLLSIVDDRSQTWDQGDIFSRILFRTRDPDLGQAGTNLDIHAEIRALHTRSGTGHSDPDAGLAFYTAPANSSQLKSMEISHDGQITFPRLFTTASSANAHLNSSSSEQLRRSTSTLDAKHIIRRLQATEARDIIRGIVESEHGAFWYNSILPADDPEELHLGFGAEDVVNITDALVTRGPAGNPDWVQYPRLVVPLVVLAADHEERIRALEASNEQ